MYSNVAQINLINIDIIATVTGYIRRASHLGSVDVKFKHTHQIDTIGYWGSNVINLFYYTFLSWNQSSYRARTYVFILQGRQYMPTIHAYNTCLQMTRLDYPLLKIRWLSIPIVWIKRPINDRHAYNMYIERNIIHFLQWKESIYQCLNYILPWLCEDDIPHIF